MASKHPRSRASVLPINGLRYRVRRWGDPSAPPLLLLHGARDAAATFQFVIDAFRRDWSIVAPDWRGHGRSDWAPRRYWTHDFLSDLDALVEAVFPGLVINLVGHSLGGNIGGLYAGLRPERVRRFVSLDGLGPPSRLLPVDGHRLLESHLAPWPRSHPKTYAALSEIAERLVAANPRLTRARADVLAEALSRQDATGRWCWLFDPGLTRSMLTLHSLEEWGAVWRRTQAPVLWIASGDVREDATCFDDETVAERRLLHPRASFERMAETGHNLHHDRPADVARRIEDFLSD